MAAVGAGVIQSRNERSAKHLLERDETAGKVREAVGSLPVRYREVIVLRYLEELTLDQIAKLLSERRNTIEVRLNRAKKLLEPLLAELMRGEP